MLSQVKSRLGQPILGSNTIRCWHFMAMQLGIVAVAGRVAVFLWSESITYSVMAMLTAAGVIAGCVHLIVKGFPQEYHTPPD